jgi:hypothetical protein
LGKFSDLINSMIKTSLQSSYIVSPRFDDYRIEDVNVIESPDFEKEISELIKENSGVKSGVFGDADDQAKKDKQAFNDVKDKVTIFDKGNVGEINQFTSSQMGNVRQIATDPTGFIIQTFMKKFAKGVGVVALALIIMEAVKWIISELLKPGRMLDIRFKRDISKEIIAFRQREDQQKLKQGFSNLIITTSPGLRGGQGQVTNTLNMAGGREKMPDNIGMSNLMAVASGNTTSKVRATRYS